MVRLVLLGKFRDLADNDGELDMPPIAATLAEVKAWITRHHPHLAQAMNATHTLMVVNQQLVRDLSLAVADGDEIAFFPPMSGG